MNKLDFLNSLTPDQSKVLNQILEEELKALKLKIGLTLNEYEIHSGAIDDGNELLIGLITNIKEIIGVKNAKEL